MLPYTFKPINESVEGQGIFDQLISKAKSLLDTNPSEAHKMAKNALTSASDKDQQIDALMQMSDASFKMGDKVNAEHRANQILSLDPENKWATEMASKTAPGAFFVKDGKRIGFGDELDPVASKEGSESDVSDEDILNKIIDAFGEEDTDISMLDSLENSMKFIYDVSTKDMTREEIENELMTFEIIDLMDLVFFVTLALQIAGAIFTGGATIVTAILSIGSKKGMKYVAPKILRMLFKYGMKGRKGIVKFLGVISPSFKTELLMHGIDMITPNRVIAILLSYLIHDILFKIDDWVVEVASYLANEGMEGISDFFSSLGDKFSDWIRK